MSKQTDITRVPKLRFPEFGREWDSLTVGDLGKVSMCKRIMKHETNPDVGVPFFKIGTFGGEPDAFITQEKFDQYKTKYPYPNLGEILISAAGTIGRTVIFDGQPAYFQDSNIVWIANDQAKVSNKFLHYCYENTRWQTEDTTIARLYNNALRSIKILAPKDKEQTKISSFLSAVDKKISQLERKKELLEQYKKGCMQKLFSQEIRFKDENGNNFPDWQEKKLGELCNITTGRLDANAMVENGEYLFFTCAREVFRIDNYAFDTDALLISGNGANVGYIHHYKGKFNAYQRTYVLDAFHQNIFYIQRFLESYLKRRIFSEVKDGNTPYIVKSTLSDMPISLPTEKEQEKIAVFLERVDTSLSVASSMLSSAKSFKKGLLQQMFV